MTDNIKLILQQLEAEKSVDRETLIEAIRSAIETAARKTLHNVAHVTVQVDPQTLAFNIYEIRTVAEIVKDPASEISLEEALKLNPDVVVGNRLKMPAQPTNFGRIAAQTARQVILQKIKDAEHERIFLEFKQREGDVVTGAVKRINHGNIIVSIGQIEAVIPPYEQSAREKYKVGDRIRAILVEVDRSPRGAQVKLSRATPDLVRALFEMEVPEIYDRTVVIKMIARDAGSRTKVAVASMDSNVDAVGACVGLKGSRVRAVVEELNGEKIDIIRWSQNPIELCVNALNPADILDIRLNEEMQRIHVLVPQDQLSLAIGKRGQNARLASQLLGWNIDISGDNEEEIEEETVPDTAIAPDAPPEEVATPDLTATTDVPAEEDSAAPQEDEATGENDKSAADGTDQGMDNTADETDATPESQSAPPETPPSPLAPDATEDDSHSAPPETEA